VRKIKGGFNESMSAGHCTAESQSLMESLSPARARVVRESETSMTERWGECPHQTSNYGKLPPDDLELRFKIDVDWACD
jgi:hypothetical protein